MELQWAIPVFILGWMLGFVTSDVIEAITEWTYVRLRRR